MTPARKTQFKRIAAWLLAGLFAAGFFYSPVGLITGPILGLWLVGTQRPLRGAVWLLGINAVLGLPHAWVQVHPSGFVPALVFLGWLLAVTVIQIIPFLFHRLVSPSFSGLLSTLPLPLCATALQAIDPYWIPEAAKPLSQAPEFVQRVSEAGMGGIVCFVVFWTAAVLLWMWNNEFKANRVAVGFAVYACAELLLILPTVHDFRALQPQDSHLDASSLAVICLCGIASLTILAVVRTLRRKPVPLDVDALRAPSTAEPLRFDKHALVSASGVRFPLRRGIPDFRTPEDLTGLNGKYNRLYQWIGGFYDDIQRVVGPMQGFDRDAYVHSYMDFLEVKPGDRVLETSVGTALNFKYLPMDIRRYGLDLSDGMLDVARTNLARWGMDANLVLGNAERLPYADESFDVVFHVGGINFFSDRAAAIREMIRVARPGSKLLIADETEEHVKATYEKSAVTSAFYSNRPEAVKPPVDLLPKEMEEVKLEVLSVVGKNRFYALTFRKPAAKPAAQ